MKYAYRCQAEDIEFEIEGLAADVAQCRCGAMAKRIRTFVVNKPSLRNQGRWDPVVGCWVDNDRQFREILKQGQEREQRELGMEVKLEQLDARDQEGLAETHGHSLDHRLETAERTKAVKHDEKVNGNKDHKPKVLVTSDPDVMVVGAGTHSFR